MDVGTFESLDGQMDGWTEGYLPYMLYTAALGLKWQS